MLDKETLATLKLSLSDNIGPITFRELVTYFRSAASAVENLPDFLRRANRRPIKLASDSFIHKQLEYAKKIGAEILTINSPNYPEQLAYIDDAPPVLFLLGNTNLLTEKCVAIVGSRNASLNGLNLTRRIAYSLVENNYVVVSGMAKGIDRAAHEGALRSQTGSGKTIAVLGTGIDIVYPKENQDIYDEIKEKGLLVSEVPFETKPVTSAFPRRNRIISGLSVGTLIVEASLMSGSLITAREALAQGREVFAVPGSPADARSAGPNSLIKDGAHLISSPEDIINLLNSEMLFKFNENKFNRTPYFDFENAPVQYSDSELDDARQKIFSYLSPEAVQVDSIIRATGLKPNLVASILIEMELTGQIERFVGQRVARIYNNEWINK